MDLSQLATLLPTLLPLVAAAALYLQRENRTARSENRKLKALVQEFELHMFTLERLWTGRGRRPPPRPKTLEPFSDRDPAEEDTQPEPAAEPAEPAEPSAPSRVRSGGHRR